MNTREVAVEISVMQPPICSNPLCILISILFQLISVLFILQSYENLLLYPTILRYPIADVVKFFIIDKDDPQGDVFLVTASAEEMVKYHIQGLAVVDKPQNIPAECVVASIAVWKDDMDEAQQTVVRVYSLDWHQQVS